MRLPITLILIALVPLAYVAGHNRGLNTGKSGAYIQQVIWTAYREGRTSIILDAIDGKLQEQEIASNDP